MALGTPGFPATALAVRACWSKPPRQLFIVACYFARLPINTIRIQQPRVATRAVVGWWENLDQLCNTNLIPVLQLLRDMPTLL